MKKSRHTSCNNNKQIAKRNGPEGNVTQRTGTLGRGAQKNAAAGNGKNTKTAGSVIFIVLVFIISVTTMVLISSIKIRSEVDFVGNEMDRLRAYAMCISGTELLKHRMVTGFANNTELLNGYRQPYFPAMKLDGRDIVYTFGDLIPSKYLHKMKLADPFAMGFKISLQDSAGLINFFKINKMYLTNFFEYNGITTGQSEIIIDSLKDWMDKDNFTRPSGAERDFYLKSYNYTPANRIIDTRDELLLVHGMDKESYTKIGHLLDFTLDNQGINPNTMPAELFHLFKGITDREIQQLMEQREETAIMSLTQFDLMSGHPFSAYPRTFQFFTSNTTYVKIKALMNINENENEDRYFYIMYKLHKKAGGGSMRRARQTTDAFSKGRDPSEDFSHYFNVLFRQEGTEVEDNYYR
ncbi:MAG: general secretion pathway protein GspK [bacterium]|nr:general secretion pathway protein GspK [bacterium]